MPDLELPIYDVFLAPVGVSAAEVAEGHDYDVHRVVVLHADQLRAEITGARVTGVARLTDAPMTYTTLWCWLALTRTHPEAAGKTFDDFKARVVHLKKNDEETETVDPTRPGALMPSDSP
jgi:hypothetical protein